jgi:hypothetical protein
MKNMNLANLGKLVLVAAFSISCASNGGHGHGSKAQVSASAKAGGVMEARVNWLKDKHNKVDFDLTLINSTEKGLIVYLYDISCMKGKVTGEVKHTFFNTGERTIDFKPGQSKEFKLVCNLGSDVAANDFKVIVKRINENLNNDGKTTGKVLARNLTVPVTL